MPRILLILLVLLWAQAGARAQVTISDAQRARIDALFASFDRTDAPGYAVGVVRDGELVYAKGFGRADLEQDRPITPRTDFHLASLSKQFTAAAIALLVQDGRLSLDTPVADFIPEVRKYGPALRIKHLLYFTSGLTEYFTLPRKNAQPWFSFQHFTTDEALDAALKVDKLRFAPGTRWAYTNTDYMLLARIVERVSGQPFADFLQQRVFTPLGMRHSLLNDDPTELIPDRATGYAERGRADLQRELHAVGVPSRPGSGWLRLPRIAPHYGGSGVFSSLEDLARWDANIDRQGAQLGGPDFIALMLRRERFAHAKDNDAFGLVHGRFQGQPMLWFAGADFDTSTFMARLTDQRLTVICLSNNPMGQAEARARAVLAILLDPS